MKITDVDKELEKQIKDKKEKEERQNDTIVKNGGFNLLD